MSFSYDETALSTELNKIRLYLGDTVSTDPFLQDEEIAMIQADYTTFYRRVAECCRLICSKLARKVDYRLSRLTEKSSVIYDRYKAMADRYEAMSSAAYPWSGSIYKADKESVEDDTSLVKPKFKKGQMDYFRRIPNDDNY